MVVIRLSREGRKKRPFNHIIVTDKRTKRNSFIERIGYFDPIKKQLHLHKARYDFWITQGAQVSSGSRVQQLLKQWKPQDVSTDNANQPA